MDFNPQEPELRIYKIVGYTDDLTKNDVEVVTEALSPSTALKTAMKQEPELEKMSDVRVFVQTTHWILVDAS